MAKLHKVLPGEDRIPSGPRRDLLAFIHRLYSVDGSRPLRALNRASKADDAAPAVLSTERISRILDGDTAELLRKSYVESFIRLVASDRQADLDEFQKRWRAFHDHHQRFGDSPQSRRRDFHADLVLSTHFARYAFDARHLVEPPLRPRQSNSARIRGSVAVMAHEFDILTSGRVVFDPDFQGMLSQSVEYGLLRGSPRHFITHEAWKPTSFIVYGALPFKGTDRPDGTFIAIEAHDRGAVSVYFEERRTRPVSQILSWWVLGAVQAAMLGHALLGSRGQADVTLLLDGTGIADHDPEWAPFPATSPDAGQVPGLWGRVWDPFIYDYLTQVPLPSHRRYTNAAWDVVTKFQQRWLTDPERSSPASLAADLGEVRKEMERF